MALAAQWAIQRAAHPLGQNTYAVDESSEKDLEIAFGAPILYIRAVVQTPPKGVIRRPYESYGILIIEGLLVSFRGVLGRRVLVCGLCISGTFLCGGTCKYPTLETVSLTSPFSRFPVTTGPQGLGLLHKPERCPVLQFRFAHTAPVSDTSNT